MIDFILQLLEIDEFKGKSERIDFVKGSHKIPMSIKEGWKQYKRTKAWQ